MVKRDRFTLRHSPEVLELQRKIYEYFLPPEFFRKIAHIFEPPPAPYQAGPEDRLMEMYLDIQVSGALLVIQQTK